MLDRHTSSTSEFRLIDQDTGEERVYSSAEELPPEARELLEGAMRGEVDAHVSTSESYVIENPDGSSHEFSSMGEAMRYIGARTAMDIDGPLQPGTNVYVNRDGVRTQVSIKRELMKPVIGLVVVGILYVAFKMGWITP